MFKVLTLIGLVAVAQAYPTADKVDTLEQFTDISFGLYSGYVSITGTQKELHYVAALSQNDPATDPVIIWFNGGPGCSSMLGFAQEHGPYAMEDGTSNFVRNDYSWNTEATMIYIESPAGVGYSKCPNAAECSFDDDKTADDNLIAVQQLLTVKFTELQNNTLWISGESYAGVYVPYLVKRLDAYITTQKAANLWYPNLKGFLVGNGVTNWKYDGTPAYFHMSYYFGLTDTVLYNNVMANCDLSFYDYNNGANLNAQCKTWMDQFNNQYTAGINIYDVFGSCYQDTSAASPFELYRTQNDKTLTSEYKNYMTPNEYTPFLGRFKQKGSMVGMVPPCVYAKPIQDYFGNATVRAQLHIPDDAPVWDYCNGTLNYTSGENASQSIYVELKGKYQILKYSGDTDGAVPTYGTQQWLKDIGWEIKTPWRSFKLDGQVAGYVQEYDGLTFVTIHGAGHMAPQWRRPQTYHAVFNFINGQAI